MARNWVWRAMLISVAVAAAACGQTARSRGDEAEEGKAGNDNTAGMPAGGTGAGPQGGAGAEPPVMGGAPNRPDECAALANDAGAALTVRIVNETSDTIYLGQKDVTCATDPLYRVHDEAGRELGQPGTQCSDCAALAAGGIAGCNASCPQPLAVALAAGEALEAPWEGLFSQAVEFPTACSSSAPPVINGKPTCWRSARAKPGAYVFSASAGKELGCAGPDGACSACQPRAGGGCQTPQGTVPELSLTASTSVTVGAGRDVVELVFSD